MNTAVKFIVSLFVPLALGALAGLVTASAIPDWYSFLNRPSFSPPNGVFGPVWTVLYLLMGLSLFLIWRLPASHERNTAMTVFFIQLALNFAWTFLFFYFKTISGAFLEIILLWISIVIMMIHFYKLNPPSMWLNIPYLLWVSFATILTGSYWLLNR